MLLVMCALQPLRAVPPSRSADTPVEITVYTDPPGAKVSHPTSAPSPDDLGISGQPMRVDPRPFKDGDHFTSMATLTIVLEGHKPARVSVFPAKLFEDRRFPEFGAIVLEPESASVAVHDFLRRHGVLLSLVVVLGVPAGVWLWRRERQRKRLVERARVIEEHRASNRDDPWLGTTFCAYRITRRIGVGGMSYVYRAVPDQTLDEAEAVAVKILKLDDPSEEEEYRMRFRREVRVSAKMDHRHVVRLIDWSEGDPCGMVMELIEGESLRARVAPGGMPLAEAMGYVRPIFRAIQYAHEMGIVHRDLKPENVMIQRDGVVKVMDFGLARGRQVTVKVTHTGTALGTPDYMAPEQIAGDAGLASDQYALGIILFELLTGRRPFDDGDMMTLLMQHMAEEPAPLSRFKPDLRDCVEPIVARMLAKDPQQRYPSVGAALDALEGCAAT